MPWACRWKSAIETYLDGLLLQIDEAILKHRYTMQNKKSILLAIVAIFLTAIAVWYSQPPIKPIQANWDDVLAEAKTGGYRIITTEALADRYHKSRSALLLIDTRQEWEYRTGHIEGALNFPMEPTRWSRWLKADELKELLGPDKDRTIVFY